MSVIRSAAAPPEIGGEGIAARMASAFSASTAARDHWKAWRGIATRYDKTPDSYLAGLHLRASTIWIKDLTQALS